MPQPTHFKKFDSRLTCADCILRTYNKKLGQLWCGIHDFPIPRDHKSKLKSLYLYTCDDVSTSFDFVAQQQKKSSERLVNDDGCNFDDWWAAVKKVYQDNDHLDLLNEEDPDSYKEYFLDNDSPRDVYDSELEYASE